MPHDLRDTEDTDMASSLGGERLTGWLPGQKVTGDRSQEEPQSTKKNSLYDLDPEAISTLCLVHLAPTGLASPNSFKWR